MSKVQHIEDQVAQLSLRELERFRAWYARFDADARDWQIEADATAGKLDQMAEEAIKAKAGDDTKPP